MEPSLSREAAIRSATKEFPNILWYQKALHRVHKSPPLVPTLSQINALCTTTSYLSKAHFNFIFTPKSRSRSRDSSVGIATVYGMDRRGSIPGKGKRVFSYTQLWDRLWGPPSLLYSGYWGISLGQGGWGVKLTTHFHVVPRPGMVELYFYSPIRLHGVMLD
jgi:hypothetical protein